MRYLGLVAEAAKLQHVKEICIIEMLARSAKYIFNKEIATRIKEENSAGNSKDLSSLYQEEMRVEIRNQIWEKNKLKREQYDKEIKLCTVDFLNTLLGNRSKENAAFWELVLIPRVHEYF